MGPPRSHANSPTHSSNPPIQPQVVSAHGTDSPQFSLSILTYRYYKSFVAFVEKEVSDNGASPDLLGTLAAILAKERDEVLLQAAYESVLPSAPSLAVGARSRSVFGFLNLLGPP